MAFIINEKKSIEDNTFKYEDRLKSPLAKYQETTPIYVTYYHINNSTSLVDAGFQDVHSIIGWKSPIRYTEMKEFPLYGIEQIVLQLQKMDQGLDSVYEGNAVILHSTIHPLPNDFFFIPVLGEDFLFQVTDIDYDTTMPDNYYKISYALDEICEEEIKKLRNQVDHRCTCKLDNLGSDKSVIIDDDVYLKLKEVKELYTDIATTYKDMFYSDRHNCFLGEIAPNVYVYDVLQTEFINNHQLFVFENSFDTLYLTNQYTDPKRKIKYQKSVYRFIERQNKDLMTNFKFIIYSALTQHETSFHKWRASNVYLMEAPINPDADGVHNIFSDEFIAKVKYNADVDNSWQELLQKHIRGEKITLDSIDLTMNETMLDLDGNIEYFIITPLILYILKKTMDEAVKV